MDGLGKIGNAIILPVLLQTMLTTNARSKETEGNVTPFKKKKNKTPEEKRQKRDSKVRSPNRSFTEL